MGFQYVPALLVPQLCFEKRRAMAIAITVCGSPLGSFICSPVLQLLINTYGWRGAIFILGAFVLNGVTFGIILILPKIIPEKRPEAETQKRSNMGSIMFYSVDRMNDQTIVSADMMTYEAVLVKLKTLFDVSLLKSGTILAAVFSLWIFFCLGFPVFANFLPLVASSYGISQDTSSFILSAFGFSDFAGRLLFGVIGSFNKINTVYIWCFVTLSSGCVQMCITWFKAVPVLYSIGIMFGISIGMYIHFLPTANKVTKLRKGTVFTGVWCVILSEGAVSLYQVLSRG